MSYYQSKNWTAKELYDAGKTQINIVVFGFDFQIIVDGHFNGKPSLYIDTRCDNSGLAPFASGPTFYKLSTLIKAIEKDLNKIFNQIKDFKTDYNKASIKHFNASQREDMIFNANKEKEDCDIRGFVSFYPSHIIHHDYKIFEKHPKIVIDAIIEFHKYYAFAEHIDYFSNFNPKIAKKAVIKILKLNQFQQKALFKTHQTSYQIFQFLVLDQDCEDGI